MTAPVIASSKASPMFNRISWRSVSRWFGGFQYRAYDTLLDWVLRNHPGARGSSIVSYAENELRLAGWYNEDAFYGDLMPKAVMRQARLFSIEGHSGMSAGLAMNLTKQVCMFRPLTPLTGADDEWNEVGEGTYQNKRCPHIFKEADGRAYDIQGKIFEEPDGARRS
jgi:hypothetical protein